MTLKPKKARKSRPFLVLPLLETLKLKKSDMPKNTGLKLFTKTWPPKRDKEESARPLTATLDKPTILNISLIGIIDMSTVRKEFLNISNLCRFPLSLAIAKRKKTAVVSRPLSLPSPEKPKARRCKKRPETSEDSYEEESVRSAKNTKKKAEVAAKKKSLSDANNNCKTFKIPRKRNGNVAKLLEVNKSDLGKSSKLPEPCKTCGRPDQQERFHSHPVTPLKANRKAEEPPKKVGEGECQFAVPSAEETPGEAGPRVNSGGMEQIRLGGLAGDLDSLHEMRPDLLPGPPGGSPEKLQDRPRQLHQCTDSYLIAMDTLWEKLRLIEITVEPMLVCFILPSIMANLATQNLNLDKACRVNLRLEESVCDGLALRDSRRYNQSDEVQVQKLVASMNAWKNVVQSFVPCLLLMFLGSWSDRHKRRKPCFLGPIVGETVACLGLLLCTFFYRELPAEFNVFFEAVPPSLTGGWFAMFMAVFSYVAEITSLQTRTLRIGAVNICTNISFTVGNALSGILLKHIGFYGIYSLAVVFYLLAFIYGVFMVKEIPRDERPVEVKKGFLRDFFDMKHIVETLKVAFKKGKRNRRARICTIMILCIVIVGPMHGEVSVLYLFLRYKFGWNEVDYSIYSTFYVVTHMFGTIFSLILFTKILKIDDAALGMLSSASRILASLVYAFAPNSLVFYIGGLVEIFNGTTFIAMRSIMSKLVPPNELGKINSLFGLSEALVPIIYGPLYSIIYKLTIHFLPGTFFIVGAALTVPSFFIFYWLYKEHRRDQEEDTKSSCNKVLL